MRNLHIQACQSACMEQGATLTTFPSPGTYLFGYSWRRSCLIVEISLVHILIHRTCSTGDQFPFVSITMTPCYIHQDWDDQRKPHVLLPRTHRHRLGGASACKAQLGWYQCLAKCLEAIERSASMAPWIFSTQKYFHSQTSYKGRRDAGEVRVAQLGCILTPIV